MDIQQIRTFVSVAQNLSFSHAAAQLGYSQAAVTVHIKHLEEELDVRLFDRLGKSIRLTSHGEVFYRYAMTILNDMAAAKSALYQQDEVVGTLRVGTIDSLCASVMPELVFRYRKAFPGVKLSIMTDTPQVLLSQLMNNELDLVYLCDEPVTDPRFFHMMESEEPVVFVASSEYPLAENQDFCMQKLQDCPIILTEKNASYRRILDYTLACRGINIDPILVSNNTDLLLKGVREGLGIAFLPRYTVETDLKEGKVREIPIADLHISVSRQLIYHKDKWINREMQAFFDLIQTKSKNPCMI